MAKDPHLTPKEARFFEAYISGMTAKDAYWEIRPRVEERSAIELGCRMLKRIRGKREWGALLDAANMGDDRLLRVLDEMLTAKTTHFWQDTIVCDVEDNSTRMHALELLARLRGRLTAELNIHHDIVEIIPPPKPEDEPPGDD
ncbi:MAG TPA: hypothetical protein VJ553_00970 [Candidatus Paceibacterota bacterium]|nr:hypothetical protein [Candidatus Paceibacterota bacterium]